MTNINEDFLIPERAEDNDPLDPNTLATMREGRSPNTSPMHRAFPMPAVVLPVGFTLMNVDLQHALYPATFGVPDLDLRHVLPPGCQVKVCFEAPDRPGERMWCGLIGRGPNGDYIGQLANVPYFFGDLVWPGDGILIAPANIMQVFTSDLRLVATVDELRGPQLD